jgi:glyoxylase-like metal-dependent hydrolase (beta-lactamase superfamily II)
MIRSVAPAIAVLTTVVAVTAAQAPRPDPLVREGATRKVSDHVYIIPDDNVPMVPNVGIIVGTTSAMVIDTGLGTRNGATVLREAQKVAGGKPIAYLATTHVHPEHDLGADAFPATTRLIRAQSQVDEIAADGLGTAENFRARSAINAELLRNAAFRKADVTFTDRYQVDLGGVRVRLEAVGFNHTRGDTIFFVDPDAVLFSGDTVMTRLPNVTGPASRVQQWLSTLDRIEAMQPKAIVPSHGPTGDLGLLAPYRAYFKGRPPV